jgi:SAM-dependent methyltransferase
MGTDDWLNLNRAKWEERTAVHLGPRGYDLSSHRAGQGRLDSLVDAALGDVAGLRILHLQSHLGDDSIALAQRGTAEVVGVDFSPAAIAAATALAAECGVPQARFVLSDVYGSPPPCQTAPAASTGCSTTPSTTWIRTPRWRTAAPSIGCTPSATCRPR